MYAAPPVLQTSVFARIKSCAGLATTNLAYGGPDNKTLYITESESGSVLTVPLEVPGQPMLSHR
jgi:gluconolactonase